MSGTQQTLLIVDDQLKLARRLVSPHFSHYTLNFASSYADAVAFARTKRVDFALVDFFLCDVHTGVDVIEWLCKEQPHVRAALWTAGVLDFRAQRTIQRLNAPPFSKLPCELHLARDFFEGKVEPRAEVAIPTLEEVKTAHARMLVAVHGSVNVAAAHAKIDRRSLQRRLNRPPSQRRVLDHGSDK